MRTASVLTWSSARPWLGVAAAAALLAALLPASPVSAAVEDICPPPGQTSDDAFTDDGDSVHEDNIDCAEDYGIVSGTTDTTYDPGGDVTRGQAATILVEDVETATGEELSTDGTDDFDDDDESVHEGNIEKAVDNGLLSGFEDGTFRPRSNITRAQFATIIVNATELALGQELESDGTDDFTDDDDSVHEDNIEKAADNGILRGTEEEEFSPRDNLSRGQTATIVIQAAGNVLHPAARWEPTTLPNEDFAVAPAERATNEVSANETDDTGRRGYEASELDADTAHEIALVPAENVTDDDGRVTFADSTGDADAADDLGETDGHIESVNGAPTDRADQQSGTSDGDGTLTFAIDSENVESVIPVVFLDADGDGALDLDGRDEPTEDFAIGGRKNWTSPQADDGSSATVEVELVDRDDDRFIGDADGQQDDPLPFDDANQATYFYDSNDLFQVDGTAVSMAAFESLLTPEDGTPGDLVDLTYFQDPAGQSTFDVTDDVVPPASNLDSEVGDHDGEGDDLDVRLTWDASPQPDAVYDVLRDATQDGSCGDGATAVTEDLDATSFTDEDPGPDTYDYCVVAVGGTSGAESGQIVATADTRQDTTGPAVVRHGAAVDATPGDKRANEGDVWNVVFTEPVTLDGASLDVQDADGDTATIADGDNSTWSVDGQTVTITLDADPTADDGFPYRVTITGATGIADAAGNGVRTTGAWSDVELEANGPEFMTRGGTSVVDSANQITLTFNEPLDQTSVALDCSDFEVTEAGSCSVATPSSDGTTVTLGGSGFEGGTTRVAIVAEILDDDGEATTSQGPRTLPAA